MENVILIAIVSLIAIVGTLTEFFKRLIKCDKKWFNELLSWFISIATAYVAWIIGYLPAISQPEWLWVLAEGVLIAVCANKGYGYDFIKKILDFIFQFIDGKWYDNNRLD